MKFIQKFDRLALGLIKKHNILFARIALFIVYFFFGGLKLLNLSPAQPLVQDLAAKTLPFINFETFYLMFALFEMLIGVLFLIRGAERIAVALLVVHLISTCMPLVLLPQITWAGFLVPTLEGQYIIKNVLIIALAFVIMAQRDFLDSKN